MFIMLPLTRCKKCGLFLPSLCFSGKRTTCRRCRKRRPFKIIYSPELNKIINNQKFCRQCSTWKTLDQYPKNKRTKDGYHSECKSCQSIRNSLIHQERYNSDPEYRERLLSVSKQWAKENRERSNEIAANWRKRNPHKAKQIWVKYREENRYKRNKERQDYYYKNHERELYRFKKYRKENRDKVIRYHRKYRKLYPEKCKERTQRWAAKNPDKISCYSSSRRARERNAEGKFTYREWKFLKELFDYRCAYCGKTPDYLTKDHLIPLIAGGKHDITNIVPACKGCNSRKHTSLDFEWLMKPLIRR